MTAVIVGYESISIRVALVQSPDLTYVSVPSFVHEYFHKLAKREFIGSEVLGGGSRHDCAVDDDSGEPLVVVVGHDQDLRIGSVDDFCIVCEEYRSQ